MTVGAIVGICIIAIIGLTIVGLCIWGIIENRGISTGAVIGCICGVILSILIAAGSCFGIAWWQTNTESGKRAIKDQQANFNGGIERVVSVYDINGDLIQQYSGKFDIETDRHSYILFDDENGNRHIIYYTTGTIIVDEK